MFISAGLFENDFAIRSTEISPEFYALVSSVQIAQILNLKGFLSEFVSSYKQYI